MVSGTTLGIADPVRADVGLAACDKGLASLASSAAGSFHVCCEALTVAGQLKVTATNEGRAILARLREGVVENQSNPRAASRATLLASGRPLGGVVIYVASENQK